jgi:transposase
MFNIPYRKCPLCQPSWCLRRWVVERTLAWVGCYLRMSKDYEYLSETNEAMIYAAMLRLMLKHLTKAPAGIS